MPYNAIEYDRENSVIKIADHYKEITKQAIPSESKEKIEKYCDNFFAIISLFLKENKCHKDDLDTAINIFFYSLNGRGFEELAILLKHEELAPNFKKNFPSFITLLNSGVIQNNSFLGISIDDCELEDFNSIKKLMKDIVKDIIEDIASGQFALDSRLHNSKKDSTLAINWSDVFHENLINKIKNKNKLEFFNFSQALALNLDRDRPSLSLNAMSVNNYAENKLNSRI